MPQQNPTIRHTSSSQAWTQWQEPKIILPVPQPTPVTHDTNSEDLDTVALDPDPAITVTGAAAAMPLAGVNPDHSIGLPATTSHATGAPVPTTIIVIHPIADTPSVDILPEMTADLTTGPDGNITNCPEDLHGNLRIEGINKLQLMTCHPITTAQMTVIGAWMMI